VIEIANLTKKFGNFTAVNSLNLKIEKGEIFGFLGPNGAGKTTTIKMMTGLITIDNGDVRIGDLSIVKNPVEYKKKTALIPDKPYMFEKLRGIEFIKFIGNLYGVGREDFKRLLDKYAEIFGITGFMNNFIQGYSHGMSQKLLIVASLIHSPEVFILDEPMVGLDPKSMRILKDEFANLAKSGMTIFMSTHSLDTAEEVCTKVGIIDKGVLLEQGSVQEIKSRNKENKFEDIFFKLTDEK